MTLPTQSYLNECFSYDPLTGVVMWRERPREHFKSDGSHKIVNARCANKQAFTSVDKDGYLITTLNGKQVKAHRVIWKMIYGTEPKHIDHDDHNRANNAQLNLKESSYAQNNRNKVKYARNSSGHTGIHQTPEGTWMARLGKRYLGTHPTLEEAIKARATVLSSDGYSSSHGK